MTWIDPTTVVLLASVFVPWLGLIVEAVRREKARLHDAAGHLQALDGLTLDKAASEVQRILAEQARLKPADPLSTWIVTLERASKLGSLPDPSALTDAFWSRETDGPGWARFWIRNSILVGLTLTSVSLLLTLSRIAGNTADLAQTMGKVMTNMAPAFGSSIVGLSLNLIAGAIYNRTYVQPQHDYLRKADGFLQGVAIPAFGEPVRTADENRLDALFERIGESATSFHKAVQSTLEETFGDLSDKLADVVTAVQEGASKAADQLGKDAMLFSAGCREFNAAASNLQTSYDQGIQRMVEAQAEVKELYDHALEVYTQIDDNTRQIQEDSRTTAQNIANISQHMATYQQDLNKSFQQTSSAMSHINDRLGSLATACEAALGRTTDELPAVLLEVRRVSEELASAFTAIDSGQNRLLETLDVAAGVMRDHEQGLQRTLSSIYDDHAASIEGLYSRVEQSLTGQVERVAEQAHRDLQALIPDVVQKTMDQYATFERQFVQLGNGLQQVLQGIQALEGVFSSNSQALDQELARRARLMSEATERTVSQLQAVIAKSLDHSLESMTDRVFDNLRDVSEALARKHEQLLDVQLAQRS